MKRKTLNWWIQWNSAVRNGARFFSHSLLYSYICPIPETDGSDWLNTNLVQLVWNISELKLIWKGQNCPLKTIFLCFLNPFYVHFHFTSVFNSPFGFLHFNSSVQKLCKLIKIFLAQNTLMYKWIVSILLSFWITVFTLSDKIVCKFSESHLNWWQLNWKLKLASISKLVAKLQRL